MSSIGPCSALDGRPGRTAGTAPAAQEGTDDTALQSLGSKPGRLLAPAGPSHTNCLCSSFKTGDDMKGVGLACRGQGFLGNTWVAPPNPGPAPSYKGLGFYPVSPEVPQPPSHVSSLFAPSISLGDTVLLVLGFQRVLGWSASKTRWK